MKRFSLLILSAILIFSLSCATGGYIEKGGPATPQEAVRKVREAVREIQKTGSFKTFKKDWEKWVWKDSRVVVIKCTQKKITYAACPKGRCTTKVDLSRLPFYQKVCKAAFQNPDGGWFESTFRPIGSSKPVKIITYVLRVPGTPYVAMATVRKSDRRK